MNTQSSHSDRTMTRSVRAAVILRRAAVVIGATSLATYVTLLVTMTKFEDLTLALQLLAAAPYGFAFSIATAGTAHYFSTRTPAEDAQSAKGNTASTVAHAALWTLAALVAVPLTSIGVVS